MHNAQVGVEYSNDEWFTDIVKQLRARRGTRGRSGDVDDPALTIVMFQDIQHSKTEFQLLWTFLRMLVRQNRTAQMVEMLKEIIDVLATYGHL